MGAHVSSRVVHMKERSQHIRWPDRPPSASPQFFLGPKCVCLAKNLCQLLLPTCAGLLLSQTPEVLGPSPVA